MPMPKTTRYDHPLTIATIIRAQSDRRTPAQWREFADRIERDYYATLGEVEAAMNQKGEATG
jgi:hypothetical protein